MAADVVITFDFEGTEKSQQKVVKQAGKTGKKAGKKAGKSFSVGFDSGLSSLKNRLIALGAAAAGAFTFKGIIVAAAKVETLSTQFRTLLGTTKAAREQMEKLSEFSARTPFQLEGIAKASRSLLAFGFSQEKSISLLEGLGDAAAASGADLGELTLIFGKVKAASKLTGRRLLQMQQRAIPIVRALADTMGIAESAVTKMITRGKVDFKTFEKAFLSLSTKGKVFSGGMETLSRTVAGRFSTLKDNVFLAMAGIGKAFEPFTKKILEDAILKVQEFKKSVDTKQLIIDVIKFGIAVNEYVVMPFTFLKDVAVLSFKTIRLGLQTILNEVIGVASGIAKAASFLGIGEKFSETMEGMAGITQQVTEDMADDLNNTLGGSFNNEFAEQSEIYLQKLLNLATKSNGIISGVEKLNVFSDEKVYKKSAATVTGIFKATVKNLGAAAASMVKTSEEMGKEISKSMLVGVGAAMTQGFAAFGAALVKGENAMEAFGKAFLGVIGDMMISLGQSFILQGIGWSANPGTLGSGAPLVAAGAALVVGGGALKALAGSGAGGSSAANAAGGGVSASNIPLDQSGIVGPEDEGPAELEKRKTDTVVNLTIQGDVLDSDSSSLKIVDLLNSAFDKQGVALSSNARFA